MPASRLHQNNGFANFNEATNWSMKSEAVISRNLEYQVSLEQ